MHNCLTVKLYMAINFITIYKVLKKKLNNWKDFIIAQITNRNIEFLS